ncbi:hypothetical protein L2026_09545 [Lactobacillus gasseri]|uniref:Uncharacterized protein n=1 Tax=Limosilactobacillus vaginalis TaxID=1633 RepID=A0ABT4K6T1_9LACO|nr:hypothetical protein [Limosilactobacillus vaginalis]MCZ3760075.1 hypothetical protein [Lactobacillus gasseri]MCZ3761773.1 hypothetical protein [Lactobacillus gasseri]MCZ3765471.1 hypothetical protein [Lactobacillus gasseri]MCZ3767028.1 hypothetical protein [Lactobacillus gasseri]MCZ3770536.1 hypothetical protein [Lactobacillus gasseri]
MKLSDVFFKLIEKFFNKINMSFIDIIFLLDLIILFLEKNNVIRALIFFNIKASPILRIYNFLFSCRVFVFALLLILPIACISFSSKFKRFFGVQNCTDGKVRGYCQEQGIKSYLKILYHYYHHLWIIGLTFLIFCGITPFLLFKNNFFNVILLIFNSLATIPLLLYSLFYVETQTNYFNRLIYLYPNSNYLILNQKKDLSIVKENNLDLPLYFLVKLQKEGSKKGKIIDISHNLSDIVYAFEHSAYLLDENTPKEPVTSNNVPISALNVDQNQSMYKPNND